MVCVYVLCIYLCISFVPLLFNKYLLIVYWGMTGDTKLIEVIIIATIYLELIACQYYVKRLTYMSFNSLNSLATTLWNSPIWHFSKMSSEKSRTHSWWITELGFTSRPIWCKTISPFICLSCLPKNEYKYKKAFYSISWNSHSSWRERHVIQNGKGYLTAMCTAIYMINWICWRKRGRVRVRHQRESSIWVTPLWSGIWERVIW